MITIFSFIIVLIVIFLVVISLNEWELLKMTREMWVIIASIAIAVLAVAIIFTNYWKLV